MLEFILGATVGGGLVWLVTKKVADAAHDAVKRAQVEIARAKRQSDETTAALMEFRKMAGFDD